MNKWSFHDENRLTHLDAKLGPDGNRADSKLIIDEKYKNKSHLIVRVDGMIVLNVLTF